MVKQRESNLFLTHCNGISLGHMIMNSFGLIINDLVSGRGISFTMVTVSKKLIEDLFSPLNNINLFI